MANSASSIPGAATAPARKAAPIAEREAGQRPRRDLIETVWVLFCSVRFAVVLNIGLALAIMIGTILPQLPPGIRNFEAELKQFLDGAQGRYGDISGVLYWAGFYDLYNSLWFRLIVVTVVFSIVICTLNRWQPTMRLITSPVVRANDAFFGTLSEKAQFRSVPLPAEEVVGLVTGALRKSRYRVLSDSTSREGVVYLYADRDRWSKLVTFVSHAGLVLLILTAAGVANVGWREQSVYFLPGEPVNVGHGLDFSVRNDGFSIDYYDDGKTVKEYRNTLAVLRDDKVVLTKTIIVNDPLSVDGVNFFLVSYKPAVYINGSRGGELVQFQEMGQAGPVAVQSGSKGLLREFAGVSDDNQPLDLVQARVDERILTFVLIYYQDVGRLPGENPPVYARVIVDQEFEKPLYDGFVPRAGAFVVPGFEDYSFTFTPDTTTILEVAKDPGLGLVGFFFMVMATGFTVSLYTTYTRCWARVTRSADGSTSDVMLGGVAEKNKVTFERDFEKLAGRLRDNLSRAVGEKRAPDPEA